VAAEAALTRAFFAAVAGANQAWPHSSLEPIKHGRTRRWTDQDWLQPSPELITHGRRSTSIEQQQTKTVGGASLFPLSFH
jgi:hypothetical protein